MAAGGDGQAVGLRGIDLLRENSTMDNVFKCTLCGAKENLKKQKILGQRLGSKAYLIHQECESGHRLHSPYSTDPSQPKRFLQCNCSN